MTTAAFLDTGVYIGYCLTVDKHHGPCNSYINGDAEVLFTGETVLDEYPGAKRKASTRYSDAVRQHISDVKRSDLEGGLGPMDLNRLKTQILDHRNKLHGTLTDFYDGLPQFIQYEELLVKLKAFERDIDTLANRRKQELDAEVDIWDPKEEHPDVRDELNLHEPDRTICVEGHDLAVHLADDTELATANPTDFVYDGQREHILEATAYSNVVNLSS